MANIKELLKFFDEEPDITSNMSMEDEEIFKYRPIKKHWGLGSSFESFSVENGINFGGTDGHGKRFGVSKKEHRVSWPGYINRYKHIIG